MLDEDATVWALGRLREYRDTYEDFRTNRGATESELIQLWPPVRAILGRIDPKQLMTVNEGWDGWIVRTREAVDSAIGSVRHGPDIAEFLGPKGPRLNADRLHPWVWESAAPVWDASKQDAVNAAARAVNTNLRAKVGSDLNEKALIESA